MRRFATTLCFLCCCLWLGAALAQETDYVFDLPLSAAFDASFVPGVHSGVRSVAGPYDLDGDGRKEVLMSDYTRGGRVLVLENRAPDTWDLIYISPVLDSTNSTENIRVVAGADLDADGRGEILFFSGRTFSPSNPEIENRPPGLYVFEHTGTNNDFGRTPASIYDFGDDVPDRWRMEQMAVEDVDGDGRQELVFGNNGAANRHDNWYILSVNGDIGSGFEVWVVEERLSTRATDDFDPVDRGGGSPQAAHFADLNGDGQRDVVLHSWNFFNFTNGTVTGADTYLFPDADDANGFLHASPSDDVSFFGGVVVDMDDDGNDEVYFPNLSNGDVSLLNYDAGEDVLSITTENVLLNLIPDVTTLGITAGDIDGDGVPELIASGPAYTAARRNQGLDPAFLRVVRFMGEDIEDPASYEVTDLEYFEPFDTTGLQFDLIQRDSAGVMTEFFRDTGVSPRAGRPRGQGADFVSKLAFLGDVDGDGSVELAVGFQGIDDTTYVIRETFNPADSTYTQELVSARPAEHRGFVRILSFDASGVAVEPDRVILPSDFRLEPNYPNPFNPSTSFTFTLPIARAVSVRIYDVAGRVVKTLIDNETYPQGSHRVTWDGTSDGGAAVASGTYLYSLEYGNFRQSRRMVLVK